MAPVTRMPDTIKTMLHVQWVALTGDRTGGSPIDSYSLQWDKASNEANWYDLIGQDGSFQTSLEYSWSSEVFPGSTYKVRVRAHNLHGWGDWSNATIIRSTGIPDKPLPPTTIMNNIYVRITWVDPDYNFEAIDKYDIRIGQSDGITFTK